MSKTNMHTNRTVWLRFLATLTLLVLALYLFKTHADILRQSLRALDHAEFDWLLAALLLTGATFILAAAIYTALALKPLRYPSTLLVELASAFTNRLLPAGLGSLGLHGLYLYKQKHSAAQATAIVSVNNLLGITAHLFLLTLLICLRPEILHRFRTNIFHIQPWYVVVAILLLGLLGLVPPVRSKLVGFGNNLLVSFRAIRSRRVAVAMVLALLLTVTYTLILFCAAWSLKINLALPEIFVIFSLGMLAGTATPTPGGLVGAEAGLFAGFVAYGVNAPAAGAAVLLYRLYTYWLPLLPGAVTLLVVRGRKIV
jgi:uncharacterized membrane protein YbhN (UPF0104 family)